MRLGIDLGGTKTEGLVMAPDGSECARMRVTTPFDDYDAIIGIIADLADQLETNVGTTKIPKIGIGMPGSLSPRTGLVRNSNSTCLNGHDIHADLTQATGRQIRLANDANCFALSEASDGAGLHDRCVFGVILSTGVGGGLVFDGTLIEDRNLIGGEWGHNPLPGPEAMGWPLPVSYCGRTGCIEAYLSGPGLVNDHRQNTNEHCEAAEIVAAAADGHVPAAATMARYEERLARALASVMNLVDPDVIVLGGGLSNISRLYENVPVLLAGTVFSDVIDTRIIPTQHGDSSGVRGAAWLWPPMQIG